VIGGAGFVGSWVVDEILKEPQARITIIDNLISSERSNIPKNPRINFVEGSASEFSTFEEIVYPVDFVYQLACFHGNQSSIARPLDDLEHGLKTTLLTLEWVRQFCPNARVLYSGAGCAIADKTWNEPTPVQELNFTSLSHDSPYSISKISGEMYCQFYVKQFNLDIIRVRFQNVYGPREILGAGKWRGTEHTIWRNVIPTFIWKALNNIDLDIFGSGSRDFVYVEDIARGISLAMNRGLRGEVYNLASGKETKILHLADQIIKLTNSESNILYQKHRQWDTSGRRLGDPSKSDISISFVAEISLNDGLERTVKWTVQNYGMITQSIDKHGRL